MTDLLKEVTEKGFVIIDGETNEKYHSNKEFISASRLKTMGQSPFHYSKYFDRPADMNGDQEEKEATKSQALGTVVHTRLLEPDSFDGEFCVMPNNLKKPTANQINAKKPSDESIKLIKEYNEWLLNVKGRIIVDEKDLHTAKLMVASALSNDAILTLLSNGKPERSIYWIDPETGLPLKCRADFWACIKGAWHTIVDVKTAVDASPEGFPKAILKYHYTLQAAMQVDGIKIATGFDTRHYVYIAIENKFPFAAAPYRLDLDDVEDGRREYMSYLRKVRACMDSGLWPGYDSMADSVGGVIKVELPSWRKMYL